MFRCLLILAGVLGVPVAVFAQPVVVTTPPSGITGGIRPLGPVILPTPQLFHPSPRYAPPVGIGGGFLPSMPQPGYPFSGIWPIYGFGGGWYPWYGYNPGPWFDPFAIPSIAPMEATVGSPGPAEPAIMLVREFAAELVLEFPAPAEVWVNGVKSEEKPAMEWKLTSPALKPGVEFTFEVKARWTLNSKTYEYNRTVKVESGNRSKALVVGGTEVKE